MTEAQRAAIHDLWDKLADFPAAQTDEALVYLLQGICDLIGADEANWFGTLRMSAAAQDEVLRGWRPRVIRHLHPAPVHTEAFRKMMTRVNRNEMRDECFRLAMRQIGTFRSFRIRDQLPPEWFRGEYYQTFLAVRGYYDSCYVVSPLHEDMESTFAFHRVKSPTDFTAQEEALTVYALRGLKWFNRQVILSYGVMFAEGPLPPMQRRVVESLLTGHSEKQIADEVGRSLHTVHKYITEIFRKYGVNSRAALMALWLG